MGTLYASLHHLFPFHNVAEMIIFIYRPKDIITLVWVLCLPTYASVLSYLQIIFGKHTEDLIFSFLKTPKLLIKVTHYNILY